MNKESFYIQAAAVLDIIDDTAGYSITETELVGNGDNITITDEIISKAQYLYDLYVTRNARNAMIKDTDWISGSDIPDSEYKTKLLEYRQALRDITDQIIEGSPTKIVWPVHPDSENTIDSYPIE